MLQNSQSGFSLLELMITLLIAGVLSVLAIPVYSDYSERARISTGLYLAGAAKQAVSEYRVAHDVFPTNNSYAGLPQPQQITSAHVQSVSVSTLPVPGTITINYKPSMVVSGGQVNLMPTYVDGIIRWLCSSPNLKATLLPPGCR